ncbi:hypothetical protein PRIPAC_74219 [Pristionchus pacificus]|uniref:G protein-coupled receptor n=1 Tax=Pristionchus pacificus TaxID=54126 RepID=A0A2A6CRQ1_PRIPA|nr:hypothetical protein PRIPAC_74219 [Pristionchus pacificus]|eukprot:PDM80819.1 G protein-coupled receptor [Pristionchus pacificus]
METNIGASSIIKWTNQTILGTLNFIFPIVNFVMILILHCSKMKAHHNTFFTLFKVTGIYGIFSMITSSNSYWSFCESNRFVFVLRKQLNGIGSFCFCTGGLMIEIQRFIVIRTSRHSENVISKRLLVLILIIQFAITAAIMNTYTFATLFYNDNGCITSMDVQHQMVIYIASASFYCSYVILTPILTIITISAIRSSDLTKNIGNKRILSLARYSIYCSAAQMLKGILQIIALISMFTGNEALSSVYSTLFYLVNLITVNSPIILLFIFSPSVRLLVAQVLCRVKEPSRNSVSGRVSLSQQPTQNQPVSIV